MVRKYLFIAIVLLAIGVILIPYFREDYSYLLQTVNPLHTIPKPPAKPAFKTMVVTEQGMTWATANERTTASPADKIQPQAWLIQLGSFATSENAKQLVKRLKQLEVAAFVQPIEQNHKVLYKVYVGPIIKRQEAEALMVKLQNNTQLKGIIVAYDPTVINEE